jgi:hypothetical protein
LPAYLRVAVLAELPRLGAAAPGIRAAESILADPRTPGEFVIKIWRVLARAYGLRTAAADGLAMLARNRDVAARIRLLAAIAGVATRVDPLGARLSRLTSTQTYRAEDFDWPDIPAGEASLREADATPAPAEVPGAAMAALDNRFAALPVDAPADDHSLGEARRALREVLSSDEVAARREHAVRKAWLSGRCRWWAALRDELSETSGAERVARLALASSLIASAATQTRRRARWRADAIVRRMVTAARTVIGDAVNLGIALLAAYAATGAVAAATLFHRRDPPIETVIAETTIIQAQLAVPVLTAVLALTIRPRMPVRDLAAAGQVTPAAAVVVAAAIWFGDGRLQLPVWQAAAELVGRWNTEIGTALAVRSVPIFLSSVAVGLLALILASTVSARSRRTSAAAHPRMSTVFRTAILVASAGLMIRGLDLDIDDLISLGERALAEHVPPDLWEWVVQQALRR